MAKPQSKNFFTMRQTYCATERVDNHRNAPIVRITLAVTVFMTACTAEPLPPARSKQLCYSIVQDIDRAMREWARRSKPKIGQKIDLEVLAPFRRRGLPVVCPIGGEITVSEYGDLPVCSLPEHQHRPWRSLPPQIAIKHRIGELESKDSKQILRAFNQIERSAYANTNGAVLLPHMLDALDAMAPTIEDVERYIVKYPREIMGSMNPVNTMTKFSSNSVPILLSAVTTRTRSNLTRRVCFEALTRMKFPGHKDVIIAGLTNDVPLVNVLAMQTLRRHPDYVEAAGDLVSNSMKQVLHKLHPDDVQWAIIPFGYLKLEVGQFVPDLGRIIFAEPDPSVETKNQTRISSGASLFARAKPDAKRAIGAMAAQYFRSNSAHQRRAAASVLRIIGGEAKEWRNLLVSGVDDDDEQVRLNSFQALRNLDEEPDTWLALNQRKLADNSHSIRRLASQHLAQIVVTDSQRILPIVLKLLSDTNHLVRIGALETLGMMRPPAGSALPSVASALNDKHPLVRSSAVATLGKYGDAARTSIPELLSRFKAPDETAKATFLTALGQIDPENASVIEAGMAGLESDSKATVIAAAGVLSRTKAYLAPHVDRLLHLMKDRQKRTDGKIPYLLQKVGPEALPKLISAHQQGPENLSWVVINVVGSLRGHDVEVPPEVANQLAPLFTEWFEFNTKVAVFPPDAVRPRIAAAFPALGRIAASEMAYLLSIQKSKSGASAFSNRYDQDLLRRAFKKLTEKYPDVKLVDLAAKTRVPVEWKKFLGTYRRNPYENTWHEGVLSWVGMNAKGLPVLKWRNMAGIEWELLPEPNSWRMKTGTGNPYQSKGYPAALEFRFRPQTDQNRPPHGFQFNQDYFVRIDPMVMRFLGLLGKTAGRPTNTQPQPKKAPPSPSPSKEQLERICFQSLNSIDRAIVKWATSNKIKPESPIDRRALLSHLSRSLMPKCPSGGAYETTVAGEVPTCSVHGSSTPNRKRSPIKLLDMCIANMKQIDGATQQWALENKKLSGSAVDRKQMLFYLKNGQMPVCPSSGTYVLANINASPSCSVHGSLGTAMKVSKQQGNLP